MGANDADCLGNGLQNPVPVKMAETIVKVFKFINIDLDDGKKGFVHRAAIIKCVPERC